MTSTPDETSTGTDWTATIPPPPEEPGSPGSPGPTEPTEEEKAAREEAATRHRSALFADIAAMWPNGLGRLIVDSAITEPVFRARGYDTIYRPADAHALGFSHRASDRVSGDYQALLVPLWGVSADGVATGYQLRPTRLGPGMADWMYEPGKTPPKYETPFGQRNMLDVNPLMRDLVLETDMELWVTEGARKVDALASLPLKVPCVGLTGVWNWRGREKPGDRSYPSVPLPDWDLVPLSGRPIVIAYDSDADTNQEVAKARRALAVFLLARGASGVRFTELPAAPDGSKQGIDDYLGAGGSLEELKLVDCGIEADHPDVEAEVKADKTRRWLAARKERGAALEGWKIMDRLVLLLRKYLILPSDAAYTAVALWAIHTHLVIRFDSTPRIAFLAPEKRCGKTRSLEVLEYVVRSPDRFFNATAAVMFRSIEDGYGTHRHITLLIDETDALFPQHSRDKADPSKEDLRAIINSGHRKGAVVKRVETAGKRMELRAFQVYAPCALAGIGHLPDTVTDRAVVVKMRRRLRGEKVAPLRFRTIAKECEQLRRDIADWALAHEQDIDGYYPEMPAGVEDRAADVWEPLLAVADELGGERWPRAARDACLQLLAEASGDDSMSRGVRLLTDIRTVVYRCDPVPPVLTTSWLVDVLTWDPEMPWTTLTGRGMADILKEYGIAPKDVHILDDGVRKTVRGYDTSDFTEGWARYCEPITGSTIVPSDPSEPVTEP